MSKKVLLSILNKNVKNTLIDTLDIKFVDVGKDFLVASMPVNTKVYQPDKILHGGATAALAETVGSAASTVLLKKGNKLVRGIELSINHLKSVRSGKIFAKAKAVHSGRTMQLWNIKITNDNDEIISIAKLTTLTL
tara:strand:+ start:1963 stop:2370 length:408 start_codon:yes stop_codon:yes gene_type:complete